MSYPCTSLSNCSTLIDIVKVSPNIVTNSVLVGHTALAEKEVDQLGSVHASVLVRVGQKSCCKGH